MAGEIVDSATASLQPYAQGYRRMIPAGRELLALDHALSLCLRFPVLDHHDLGFLR